MVLLFKMFIFYHSKHSLTSKCLGTNATAVKRVTIFVPVSPTITIHPIALRKAKIVYNFSLSECNRVKGTLHDFNNILIIKETLQCLYKAKKKQTIVGLT